LRQQIPKAKKDTGDLTVFMRFWDLVRVNILVKLSLGLSFDLVTLKAVARH